MRFTYKHIIILLIASFVLFSVSAYAQTNRTNLSGGYYFTEGQNINPDAENHESPTSEGWKLISFWDLPLWVKIAIIPTIITSIVGILVSAPIVIGKLRRKNSKGNPVEESIEKYIDDNPDCTIAEIASDNRLSRGKARYYLDSLISQGKVALYRVGRFTRLSMNKASNGGSESMNDERKQELSLKLQNKKKRIFVYAILDNPGTTNQDLSSRFNLDKSTVHDYLKELHREGFIRFEKDGRFKRCYVNSDVEALLV